MNYRNSLEYQKVHIGKFISEEYGHIAIVIYHSIDVHHVTIYEGNVRIISKNMKKSDWNVIRESLDLVLEDVQDMEMPKKLVKEGYDN